MVKKVSMNLLKAKIIQEVLEGLFTSRKKGYRSVEVYAAVWKAYS